MAPLLLLLAACAGCKSCNDGLPSTPDNEPVDGEDGGAEPEDGGGDGGDTGPEPPCDFPEVEPNTLTQPQEIPMETWVCGEFGTTGDADFFTTEIPGPAWAQIWVRAVEIGSQADVQIIVSDEENDYTAYQEGSYGSSDPVVTFPLDHDRDFLIQVRDSYDQHGEGYIWEMMVSRIKAPVTWESEESEPNDSRSNPEPIESGVATFGTIGSADDEDWFTVTVPDGGGTLGIHVDAWMFGSPADTRVSVYEPDGTYYDNVNSGVNVYDYDPKGELQLPEGGDWIVKINSAAVNLDQGSDASWYVLTVTVSTDDGSGDSGG